MPQLKVDSITNRSNNAPPELPQGATIPSGKTISGAGNINVVGVLTATAFSGNGSGLTGLSFIAQGKALAIKIITDSVLPFRS
jgi:hypothetical protein